MQVTLTKKKKKKLGMAPNKVAVCASLIIKKAYYKEAEKNTIDLCCCKQDLNPLMPHLY